MYDNSSTIDVYGQVIPDTGLFVTVWYMYLVSCIISLIADVYMIGGLILWAVMQKRCFEFSIVTLYMVIVILCQLPMQVVRWIILCWKAPGFMVIQIIMCCFDIIITLVRTHYGPEWEEIKAMDKFALGEFAELISRFLLIGSNIVEIIMVSIMLSEVVKLYNRMHPDAV